MIEISEGSKGRPEKAKVWTVVWNTLTEYEGPGCWHVEWGRNDGPDIKFETIKELAALYFEANKLEHFLKNIRFITNTPYGHWNGTVIRYNNP
jgi:hypothetical protein